MAENPPIDLQTLTQEQFLGFIQNQQNQIQTLFQALQQQQQPPQQILEPRIANPEKFSGNPKDCRNFITAKAPNRSAGDGET